MTYGVFLPTIVFPSDAQNWRAEDLDRAIVHELSQCLARAVCAAYWFHPLVWVAWRRLLLEADRASDDAVVRRSEATAYADQLVELARRLSAAQRLPLPAMAARADLATCLYAVLDNRQPRGRAGTLSVNLACGAAAALIAVLSPLTVVAAPQAATNRLPAAESITRTPAPPKPVMIAQERLPKPSPEPARGLPPSASPLDKALKVSFKVSSERILRIDVPLHEEGVEYDFMAQLSDESRLVVAYQRAITPDRSLGRTSERNRT